MQVSFCTRRAGNNNFTRDVCYATAPHTPLKLAVMITGYQDQWTTRSKSSVYVEIDAQAGHTYFIYPTFPSKTTWQPKVIDIASDEDYLKIEDPSDRELLKIRIADYLSRGERWPLVPSTETPGYWEARFK